MAVETGILLESGTNELELLEFVVGNQHYGINVAKIREILPYQVPTPIPNADARIEGIFMPRDEIISIVDEAHEQGVIEENEAEMIQNIILERYEAVLEEDETDSAQI